MEIIAEWLKITLFLRKGGKMGKDDDIFYDNHYNFADFPWVCEIIFIILHLKEININYYL